MVLVSHRSAFVASRVCSHCTLSRIMLSLSLVLVIVRDYVVLVRDYVVLPCSPCVFQGLCCSCVVIVVFISCVDLVRSLDDESVVVMPL